MARLDRGASFSPMPKPYIVGRGNVLAIGVALLVLLPFTPTWVPVWAEYVLTVGAILLILVPLGVEITSRHVGAGASVVKAVRPAEEYTVEQARKYEEMYRSQANEAQGLRATLDETNARLGRAEQQASVSLREFTAMVDRAVKLVEQRDALEKTVRAVSEALLPKPKPMGLFQLLDEPQDEVAVTQRAIDSMVDAQSILLEHRRATLGQIEVPKLPDGILPGSLPESGKR